MENSSARHREIVQEIEKYMNRTGKKQYELAAEIGVPPQTVNRWLNGKAAVSKAYSVILKSKGIIP